MKTKALLLCILLACFHPLNAQLMSVYHRDSVPTYYEVSKIDSIRFIHEQPYDVITTFRYTGSFSSPTSLVWGNTGMIPMEYGQSITYTSEGLNDYCCVFFNARMEPIYYGKRAPGLSDDNQYATVITESLVAPKETAYVCIYGKTNTSHPSYIPYELKVEINRLNNSGFYPDHVTEGSDGINPLSFAKILQMLIAGYTNTEMANSMGISDLFDDSCQLEEIEGGEFNGEPCITLIDDDTIDGQIPSSLGKTTASGYGYFSLLLPFTLSLQDRWGVDVKAGLACEGHRVGLTPYLSSRDDYDELNANGKLVRKLNEKLGWEVLNHSMTAQLPVNTYGVESIDSELASKILSEGKYEGAYSFSNTIVLDKSTGKWYEVNKDRTKWIERVPTKKYAQLYYRDYGTNNYHINRDFDFDYSWGEWFRRAGQLGLPYISSIVYNGGTTSPFTIANSRKYADFGIRTHMSSSNVPPLTAAVHRFTVAASSADNVQVDSYKQKMAAAVDQCISQNSWLVFMIHTYNASMYNGYNSNYSYSSKDDDYPSEWIVPLKKDEILSMDENNYWENPPARLGIARWADWRPAPGTQLSAFYEVMEYAIKKGVKIVLPSEGWSTHGNRIQLGVDMNGTEQIYNIVDDYTDEEQSFFTVGAEGTVRYHSK